jgi:molybdopterin-guanine dinucleotide biosynthesis protein A
MKIPAILFAGGKSSRMGRDKALLPFGEASSLASYQYQWLSLVFDSVYLSAKNNKFDFDCEVIEDKYEESSPLIGLISAFETLEVESIFVLSVDTPFVNTYIIERLIEANHKGLDCIIAQSPRGLQPLCGIYKRSIYPLLKQQQQDNNHRLQSLIKKANTHSIAFEEDRLFMNLNYKEEYEEALRVVKLLR